MKLALYKNGAHSKGEIGEGCGKSKTRPNGQMAGCYAIAGMVDAHAHLSMDMGAFGLPDASAAVIEANWQTQLAARSTISPFLSRHARSMRQLGR